MPDQLNLNSEVVPAAADLTDIANGIQEPPIDQAELDRLEAKRVAGRERTRKHRAAKKEQTADDHYAESRGLPVSDDRKRQLAHWRAIGQVNDSLSDEMDLARSEMSKQDPPAHLNEYLAGLIARLNEQLETNLKEQKLGMSADVIWLGDIKSWYWGAYRTYLLNKHNPDWRDQLAEALPQANDGNGWTVERLKRAVTGMSEPDNWAPEMLTAPLPELKMPDADKAVLEVKGIIKQAKQWVERQEQQYKAMRNGG
jgi:hypothetical protein